MASYGIEKYRQLTRNDQEMGVTRPRVISTAGAVTLDADTLHGYNLIHANPNGAARTYTFDTATNLISRFTNREDGNYFKLQFTNIGPANSSEKITLAAGAGVTIVGPTVVDPQVTVEFMIRITGASTVTVNVMGSRSDVGVIGTVTQITSTTTGVTLNANAGRVTMVSSTLAAGAEETFTVTNDRVTANSIVIASMQNYGGAGLPYAAVTNVAAGSFNITLTNLHASSALNNVPTVSFIVIN